MDKKLKRKWIRALRSGQYKQTQGQLCRGGQSFCCLGVLVNEVVGYDGTRRPHNLITRKDDDRHYYDSAMPSRVFHRQVGLDESVSSTLAQMNDGGKPFAEIADYIEEFVE